MRTLGLLLAAMGVALHAWTTFGKASEVAAFTLLLLFVSSAPYLIGAFWLRGTSRPLVPATGMLLALVVDVLVYRAVFVAPGASTAALGLVAAPFWNLLVVMPAGCFLAWGVLALRARLSRPSR